VAVLALCTTAPSPHADEKRQGEAGVENEDQDEQRDERAFPADR